ncbi:head scaffolding protein [Staphylococcus phage MVC_VPHSA2]|uniref:Head scaffolding protein n=1 Tax=Staphylococcus phage MVC_VPHSA1 TaxID=3088876 RepID=A0ABZ0QYI7_9CAUD|nr:head scaffolding protein [Staphylococcus phage MVC_VPHSA1]WPF64969.1 head scaffolding protein [Staphylococcus phage MVC_VPHSA2]
MARNKVEYHIQAGSTFTFKVKAGSTLKIGDVVEISGAREVTTAAAGSEKVAGVVYSGTVGVDGVNVGYQGDRGDVVTVIILRPFVYMTASAAIPAGAQLKAAGANKVAAIDTATDKFTSKIGLAITPASAANDVILVALG